MPHLSIRTNVSQINIPADFAKNTCQVVAKVLGKPLSYCVCSVIGGVQISWGGTDDPCAVANMMSIGKLGVEENKKISKVLYDHICSGLKISPDKMYIVFQDEPTGNVGYNGTTFHEIFG